MSLLFAIEQHILYMTVTLATAAPQSFRIPAAVVVLAPISLSLLFFNVAAAAVAPCSLLLLLLLLLMQLCKDASVATMLQQPY